MNIGTRSTCTSVVCRSLGIITPNYRRRFKLRMSPSTFTRLAATSHLSVPPLPPFLSIIEILGDLLAYLLSCAENFIQETHPAFSAQDVWEILRLTAKLVITHPDSWNFTQRSILTQAAVHAGIIGSSSIEREQIIFVPEGEADLYYCLRNVESVKVSLRVYTAISTNK